MAGSAVNLTGMLGQLANSIGDSGSNIGRGLFDPLLAIQQEQRAEKRKKEEVEDALKLRSETLKSYSEPLAKFNQGKEGGDARHAEAGANEMLDKAVKAGDTDQYNTAQDMLSQVSGIKAAGALKGVQAIDQALADPSVDPRAKEALLQRRATLMQNPDVQAGMQQLEKQRMQQEQAKVTLENARADGEAKQRKAAVAQRQEVGRKAMEAGRNAAVMNPNVHSMTEEEVSNHLKGKPSEYQEEFTKYRAKAITRYKKVSEIDPNVEMTEAEFNSYGLKHMTYKDYLKRTSSGIFTGANKQVTTMYEKEYQQAIRDESKNVNLKSINKVHLDNAEELMNASRTLFGNDRDFTAYEQNLVALATANGVHPKLVNDAIEKGALSQAGRLRLEEALEGQGNPMPPPVAATLTRPSDVPEKVWDLMTPEEQKVVAG